MIYTIEYLFFNEKLSKDKKVLHYHLKDAYTGYEII